LKSGIIKLKLQPQHSANTCMTSNSYKRTFLLQYLIDKYKFKNYLEIGVFAGRNFFKIKADNKIGIDPAFKFLNKKSIADFLSLAKNYTAKYFQLTSDDFFEKKQHVISKSQLDICLIDGMHEYEYVIRDVHNCLKYLKEDGILILHDCNPPFEKAACSFKEWVALGGGGTWNGDVWKAMYYFNKYCPQISCQVLDTDFGLGVIRKKSATSNIELPTAARLQELQALDYKDLDRDRVGILNLKPAGEYVHL
jgi:SAM-dependent methyltransferase